MTIAKNITNQPRIFENSSYDNWTDDFRQNVACRLNLDVTAQDLDDLSAIKNSIEYKTAGGLGRGPIYREQLPERIVAMLDPFKEDFPEPFDAIIGGKYHLADTPYMFGQCKADGCIPPHVDIRRQLILLIIVAQPEVYTSPFEAYYDNGIVFIDNKHISFYAIGTKTLHGVVNAEQPERHTFQCTLDMSYSEFKEKYSHFMVDM